MEIHFVCPLNCGLKIVNVAKHIQKCKNKNLLGKTFIQCPFNKNHICKKEIYSFHSHSCQDNPNNVKMKKNIDAIKLKNEISVPLEKLNKDLDLNNVSRDETEESIAFSNSTYQ
jgi:hypothetical protein